MSAPRMVLTIPEGVPYRAEAVVEAATLMGYVPTRVIPNNWKDDDVLVTWNLHRNQQVHADACSRAGGRVVVMENGYNGRDRNGHQLYAMARDGHNGSGWYPGASKISAPAASDMTAPGWSELMTRWYRQTGDWFTPLQYDRPGYTLVIGQRGIGSQLMRSPANWHRDVGVPFAKQTWPDSPVRVREHPGQGVPLVSLAEDLAGAARVVQWSSACGVAALRAGVPVYYAAPRWIASIGAHRIGGPDLITDQCSVRHQALALVHVSIAQWSIEEIRTARAFRSLLSSAAFGTSPVHAL